MVFTNDLKKCQLTNWYISSVKRHDLQIVFSMSW